MKRVFLSLFLLTLLPLAVQAQADKKLIEKAQKGNPAAMVRLAECYENGAGVAHDSTAALQWFQKAAALGDGNAWVRLSSYYLRGTLLPKDTARYLAIRQEWADKGLPDGIAALGSAYLNGYGVAADTAKAVELYQQAAKKGSGWGLGALGRAYYTGEFGLAKDEKKGLAFLEKAYKAGDMDAPGSLARHYAGKDDYKTTWKWVYEGMKWNEPYAITLAALMYFNGNGTDTNQAKALEMMDQIVAEHRNAPYPYSVAASLHANADKADTAKALRIWESGDALGFSICQMDLGYHYASLEQYEKSFNYFRKAANGHDNEFYQGQGCFSLGQSYYQGLGCEQSAEKCMEWLKRGADKFHHAGCASALASFYLDEQYLDIPQAVKYFRLADKYGDTTAMAQLGHLYANNGNVEQAMECYQEMINKGKADGYYHLGLAYNSQGQEKECIKSFETGEKKGSRACSEALGIAYENGISGVKADYAKAAGYYHKAATPYALYREGIILVNNGLGKKKAKDIAQDEARGIALLQQSADQGHVDAIYTLGYCYETGTHVDTVDHVKALSYFRPLAENEIAAGQFKMGLYYELGDGGLKADSAKAIEYYQLAAAQGHGEAMCYLGDFHRIGRFLPLDKQKAFEYYLQAHQSGEEMGTYYVSRSYLEGCGVAVDTTAALPYLYAASAQGVGNASYKLATFYNYGIGTLQQNADSALYYYFKGHEDGSADASYFLGHQLINEEEYEQAVQYLFVAAQRGSTDGMTEFALLVQQGVGTEADPASAYKIWENVIRRTDNPAAYCQLGIACLQGNGCPEDEALGKAYLDTAANLGSTLAMRNLGYCYLSGYGCRVDTTLAVSWLEKAADNGDIRAINSLGDIYEEQEDFKNAALYYEKAVAAGDLDGYCNLGYCYERGQGVILNSQKAYDLYMVAAEHGSARGCRCVANCYFNGIHVAESASEGFRWMEKAAEMGDVMAMYYCGALLEEGQEGLPADPKKAREWYKKAAAEGYEPAAAALNRM